MTSKADLRGEKIADLQEHLIDIWVDKPEGMEASLKAHSCA